MDPAWRLERGDGPVVAVALHHGHDVRPALRPLLALDEPTRLREEDPHTGPWTAAGDQRLVVLRSRFELDLNRPRADAVYLAPDHCWGLEVWRAPPPEDEVRRSRALWDTFYRQVRALLNDVARRHGWFLVLDLHSFNHRRAGPAGPPTDPARAPDVNLGTASIDRARWGGLVERFGGALADRPVEGRRLDVRENVNFMGGHFPRWVNATFAGVGCALAVEVKKTFMDEWTGALDRRAHAGIGRALREAAAAARAVPAGGERAA